MAKTKQLLGLDVGTVRIGTALADMAVRIAIPSGAVDVNGSEYDTIARIITSNTIDTIVIGYPRNQSGDPTEQTKLVTSFAEPLKNMVDTVVFQDESLSSVLAESRLVSRGKPYSKADIDSEAAVIILQDYLEQHA